jgi:putative transcriptional regulator
MELNLLLSLISLLMSTSSEVRATGCFADSVDFSWFHLQSLNVDRTPGEETSGEGNLTLEGQLLIAHPNLRDPNFRRTILFLAEHDPDAGAFGVIVNRPTDLSLALFWSEAFDDLLRDIPVYEGGPVATDELMFIGYSQGKGGITVQAHLSPERAAEFLRNEEGILRAYKGYAGWSEGQLEYELAQNSWLVRPPTLEVLGDGPKTWYQAVSAMGPVYRLLALAPDRPELN